MPAVVSDTSVINYLAAVDQAELLRTEFGKIFIPRSVARASCKTESIRRGGVGFGACIRLAHHPTTEAKFDLNQLFADLDPGEAEAIALACELKPATVLLDETDGRAAARRLGLPTIGTIGILARARQSGRLQKIKPLLDRKIFASV